MADERANEAEQSVLGAVIINPATMGELAKYLRPEHFSTPQHQGLYSIMLDMYITGKAIDIITLKHLTMRRGVFSNDGEAKIYLTELAAIVPNLGHIRDYIDIILRSHKARKCRELAGKLLLTNEDTVAEDMVEVQEEMGKLATDAEFGNFAPLNECLSEALKTACTPDSDTGLSIGIGKCDAIMGRIRPKDYVLVAARPAVGKSAFATQLVLHNLRKGKTVAFVTLEMSRQEVIERMWANMGAAEMDALGERMAAEDKGLREQLGMANDEMAWYNLYINDYGHMTVAGLRAWMAGKSIDMVIIDHIGLMDAGRIFRNRVDEIAAISRGLRMLAMTSGVPIIAMSQLSRAPEARADHRPVLSDLRDSGSLEQDACKVIMLSKYGDEGSGLILFDVAKNRQGMTGTVVLQFYGGRMRFTETAIDYEEPQTIGARAYGY